MNAVTALVRLPQLRRRTGVTIALLMVVAALTHLRVPGVDASVVTRCQESSVVGVAAVANFFGGGALAKLSYGAVGVMPFITASIILILAARVVPPLGRLVAERGRSFYVAVTTLTVLLSAGQAVGTAVAASHPGGLLPGCGPVLPGGTTAVAVAAVAMLAGTGALLGLGAAITRWGLGNGVSLIIALGVLTVLPAEVVHVAHTRGLGTAAAAVGLLLLLVAGLAWLTTRNLHLPATLTWRSESDPSRRRRLPFPLNPAGVMPLILASTLVSGPLVLDMLTPGKGWPAQLAATVSAPHSPWHLVALAAATVALTFYWTIVTWDAEQMAERLDEHGVTLDGATDAADSAHRIDTILLRGTVVSSVLLAAMALLPSLAVAVLGTSSRFPLGGSTLLVMVAIGADTLKRIRADVDAARDGATVPETGAPAAAGGELAAVSDEELDAALVSLGKVTHRLV